MKSQSSEFSPSKFAHHLSALTRERIDITALSLGGSVARGSAKAVFWGLLAFFFFFLFLSLNMALGFALGTCSGGSPAIGFLYLAVGYLGLIVLVILLRPWLTKRVRDHVSRRALTETQRLNMRLDLIPYLRRQHYNSPSRAIHQEGSYLILEQARYQTLLLQDETFPKVVQGLPMRALRPSTMPPRYPSSDRSSARWAISPQGRLSSLRIKTPTSIVVSWGNSANMSLICRPPGSLLPQLCSV